MGVQTHGHAKRGQKTPLYRLWRNIVQRCTDANFPQWQDYGGRGITVCAHWRSFSNFLADVGDIPKGMTFDRIDNARGYEPGNWRWATRSEQMMNRRMLPHQKLTREQHLAVAIDPRTMREIARDYGVVPQTVHKIKLRYDGVLPRQRKSHSVTTQKTSRRARR